MFPATDNTSGILRTFNKCGQGRRVLFKIIVSSGAVDKIYARRGSWKQAAIRITKETNGGSRGEPIRTAPRFNPERVYRSRNEREEKEKEEEKKTPAKGGRRREKEGARARPLELNCKWQRNTRLYQL